MDCFINCKSPLNGETVQRVENNPRLGLSEDRQSFVTYTDFEDFAELEEYEADLEDDLSDDSEVHDQVDDQHIEFFKNFYEVVEDNADDNNYLDDVDMLDASTYENHNFDSHYEIDG